VMRFWLSRFEGIRLGVVSRSSVLKRSEPRCSLP
jgi:hypothetical protein